MTVIGVDGCKDGWFAVALHDDGSVDGAVVATASDIVDRFGVPAVIAIDMPLALPDTKQRTSELLARELLGSRRSSVFMSVPHSAIAATTHREATARSQEILGKGMSAQAYGLRSKILELNDWLPHATCPVIEVHPELTFTMMNAGEPAAAGKKTFGGIIERRALLVSEGIDVDSLAVAAGRTPADDVLDATAAAWTARRWVSSEAVSLPDPAEFNSRGQPMAIWY